MVPAAAVAPAARLRRRLPQRPWIPYKRGRSRLQLQQQQQELWEQPQQQQRQQLQEPHIQQHPVGLTPSAQLQLNLQQQQHQQWLLSRLGGLSRWLRRSQRLPLLLRVHQQQQLLVFQDHIHQSLPLLQQQQQQKPLLLLLQEQLQWLLLLPLLWQQVVLLLQQEQQALPAAAALQRPSTLPLTLLLLLMRLQRTVCPQMLQQTLPRHGRHSSCPSRRRKSRARCLPAALPHLQ